MKILQINSVYPFGSTGKITADIHHVLQEKGYESFVLFGRGPNIEEKSVIRLCSDLYAKMNVLFSEVSGIPYGGCFFSTYKAIKLIKKIRPDVVHLQCINEHFVNIYQLIEWLNNNRVSTVLTLHAEFMYTANCGHAYECEKWKVGCKDCPRPKTSTKTLFFDRTQESFFRMQKAFAGFDKTLRVVSVSPWLEGRAKSSLILGDKRHSVILNGLNTKIFHYGIYDRRSLFGNQTDKKIIIHVTALFRDREDDAKGGMYVLSLAKRMKKKNVLVVVAGKYELISSDIPDNLLLLGEIKDQKKLAAYYSSADLTVITSKRETYSMICAESLCCGTPVVGFQAGAPETISLPKYSEFVRYGDKNALQTCVEHWINKTEYLNKKQISQEAIRKYRREKMVEEYEMIYKELVNDGPKND